MLLVKTEVFPDADRPGQTRRETGTQSQGSATRQTARPPMRVEQHGHEVANVKANLARFTMALTLLASMALTLGAGIKWY
jgi:hypothetical protein